MSNFRGKGTAHGAIVDYLLSDKKEMNAMEGRAELLHSNMLFGSAEDMKKQLSILLDGNKLSHDMMHLVVSFPVEDNDKFSSDVISSILLDLEERLGIASFPYLAVRHYDKDETHPHIHLAIARKSPISGKTLRTSNNYQLLGKICRDTEKQYNLKRLTPYGENYPYNDSRKAELKGKIENALSYSTSLEDFKQKLSAVGIKTFVGRGIVYIHDNIKCKGSDKQIGYSLKKVKEILGETDLNEENKKAQSEFIKKIPNKSYEKVEVDRIIPKIDILGSLLTIINGIPIASDGQVIGAGNIPHSEDDDIKKKKSKKKRIKIS